MADTKKRQCKTCGYFESDGDVKDCARCGSKLYVVPDEAATPPWAKNAKAAPAKRASKAPAASAPAKVAPAATPEAPASPEAAAPPEVTASDTPKG
jgi:uncharacterized Zn finger protein (UPF0148 family)